VAVGLVVASIIQTTNAAHTTGPTTTYTYSSPTSPCESTNFDYAKTVVQRPDNTSTTYCANDHAQITHDTDNPTAATPSGEWYDLHDGYTRGTGAHTVTLAGVDAGAGIKKLSLEEVGGVEIAAATLPCDPRNAVNPIACPHTTTQTATFDPSGLAEGQHAFRARATDYAGRSVVSAPWNVAIDRTAPPAATAFSVTLDDDDSNALRVFWANADDPNLPDATPGSGVDTWQFRWRVQGATDWSPWSTETDANGLIPNASLTATYEVQVITRDAVGNESASATALLQYADEWTWGSDFPELSVTDDSTIDGLPDDPGFAPSATPFVVPPDGPPLQGCLGQKSGKYSQLTMHTSKTPGVFWSNRIKNQVAEKLVARWPDLFLNYTSAMYVNGSTTSQGGPSKPVESPFYILHGSLSTYAKAGKSKRFPLKVGDTVHLHTRIRGAAVNEAKETVTVNVGVDLDCEIKQADVDAAS
jgi:hypothetical protein